MLSIFKRAAYTGIARSSQRIAKMRQEQRFPLEDFEFDLARRMVLHRPSGIPFSFERRLTEEDWASAQVSIYRDNPDWIGDRSALAAAAKEAAIACGMRAS
jgi:hypothetical protein